MKFQLTRGIMSALCLSSIIGMTACSTQTEQVSEVEKQTRLNESNVVGFAKGSVPWTQLSGSQQTLYSNIYGHKLDSSEQTAWESVLKKNGVGESTDGKLNLPAPVGAQTAANESDKKESGVTNTPSAADSAKLVATAQHIRAVWHKEAKMTTLTKDEVLWYRAIYTRSLPAEQMKKWDEFLATPVRTAGGTRSFGVSSVNGMPAGGGSTESRGTLTASDGNNTR